MTRTDKIANYTDKIANYTDKIANYLSTNIPGVNEMTATALASQIMELATPTAYASIKDVADLTGRTKGTILSWLQRGQHDCPPALGWTSAGMVWDRDDWKRWANDHPGLVYQDAGRTDLV